MMSNPRLPKEWSTRMEGLELLKLEADATMETVPSEEYKSASKMEEMQFLLLRVLWTAETPNSRAMADEMKNCFEDDLVIQATKQLRGDKDWNLYLDNLSGSAEGRRSERRFRGLFAIAHWQQLAIVNAAISKDVTKSFTPTKELMAKVPVEFRPAVSEEYLSPRQRKGRVPPDHSYKPQMDPDEADGSIFMDSGEENQAADDEQIVNQALISLLDSILYILPDENALEVTAKRQRFKFGKLWTAITDGSLREMQQRERVHAIIEVKAAKREYGRQHIQWQEAGEMAAWMVAPGAIGEHKCIVTENKNWRLLIAQDRDEIFVVIAKYGADYLKYLKGTVTPSVQDDCFMRMIEYGPFKYANPRHMESFAIFIHAFCLLQQQPLSAHMQNLSLEEHPPKQKDPPRQGHDPSSGPELRSRTRGAKKDTYGESSDFVW